MAEQTYTYHQLSRAFHNYLMERFDGDEEEVRLTVETAERIIPNTLNDYFGTKYESIYEITEADDVENFRKKVKIDPILKGIDKSVEPSYTEVLKWYRLFVKALSTNSIPVPVPGEYESEQDDDQQTHIVSEKPIMPKKQTTIFTEGEDDGTITEEHRKRNMELRQACIDYFKTLHGGRIVCQCCGFDFAKTYDIDDEYIEVHHRFPFSHTDGAHPVDAITDLVPLCANCHRMIHHGMGGRGNCMSLDDLKKKLTK